MTERTELKVRATEAIQRAHALAVAAHEGQTRWDGTPYVAHPRRVAERAAAALEADGVDATTVEYAVQAALLHDVVEDCDVTLADLVERRFASVVVEAVDLLTRRKAEGESHRAYVDRIARSLRGGTVASVVAAYVKLADLADNSAMVGVPADRLVEAESLARRNEKHALVLRLALAGHQVRRA